MRFAQQRFACARARMPIDEFGIDAQQLCFVGFVLTMPNGPAICKWSKVYIWRAFWGVSGLRGTTEAHFYRNDVADSRAIRRTNWVGAEPVRTVRFMQRRAPRRASARRAPMEKTSARRGTYACFASVLLRPVRTVVFLVARILLYFGARLADALLRWLGRRWCAVSVVVLRTARCIGRRNSTRRRHNARAIVWLRALGAG